MVSASLSEAHLWAPFNVLSASNDFLLYECLRQCTRAKLDICLFQECRRLGHDSLSVPVTIDGTTALWDLWWSG